MENTMDALSADITGRNCGVVRSEREWKQTEVKDKIGWVYYSSMTYRNSCSIRGNVKEQYRSSASSTVRNIKWRKLYERGIFIKTCAVICIWSFVFAKRKVPILDKKFKKMQNETKDKFAAVRDCFILQVALLRQGLDCFSQFLLLCICFLNNKLCSFLSDHQLYLMVDNQSINVIFALPSYLLRYFSSYACKSALCSSKVHSCIFWPGNNECG